MTDREWLDFRICRNTTEGTWHAAARTPILSDGKSYWVAVILDVKVYKSENVLRRMLTNAFNARKQ